MALSVVLEISQLVEGEAMVTAAPCEGCMDRIIEETDGRCITLLLLKLAELEDIGPGPGPDVGPGAGAGVTVEGVLGIAAGPGLGIGPLGGCWLT